MSGAGRGERVWVGVDLGTQSARALAVTDDGTVVAAASHPLSGDRHEVGEGAGGSRRHEQDPRDWCRAAAAVLAEVTGRVDPRAVAGISVDATSGTVVLVDADEDPLTPGVMYDDDRGAGYADAAQDAGAALWERLGHRIGPSWALPTVLALLAEHPDGRVRHQGDVVTGWLVGSPTATDASTALKTGYDAAQRGWPRDVLARLGIDPAALPAVVAPGAALGGLGREAADATGLPVGVPVRAGMTDGCAAQLGAGAVSPGAWNAVLGTTLVLKGVTATLLHDPDGTVYSHRAPQGGWWLPGGASSTGAGILADVVHPDRFDAVTARLGRAAPRDVPVAYPLAGHGERFPFAAPDAEGFWLDGDRPRPLPELAAAVGEDVAFAALCEGVAHVERLCFAHVAALGADVSGPRTVSGGAVANRWWTGRRAALLGVPLRVPASAEPAFGMALLARAAVEAGDGEPDVVAAAAAMVRVADVVEPHDDPALAERHARFVAELERRGWLPAGSGSGGSGSAGSARA